MRISIFSRLVIGYLIILLLLVTASAYAILQLSRLNDIASSILSVDNRMIEFHKMLADGILSEMRNEKKYIISQDQHLYDQFHEARDDFSKKLKVVMEWADSEDMIRLLEKISGLHLHYHVVFDEQVEHIKAKKNYPEEWYGHEKEKTLNGITEGLKQLKTLIQISTYEKIQKIADAGESSRKVAMAITAASLFMVIAISVVITRNITRPLASVKGKTRKIAKGNFGEDLNISSPPEMSELASAFNLMCRKLQEVDEIKNDFFSLMSHELRTPLSSIKEGTNLLLEGLGGDVPEKQKRLLSIISEESNRLIELVSSLLDLSKMEAGMLEYNLVRTNLGDLIHRAVTEIMPLAEARNIRIEKDINELPPVKVDSEKMLRVIRNLLDNAVKFSPGGGCVTVTAHRSEKEVKVSVANNGPGIKKEHLASIFDKFQQAPARGSDRLKGTGLGLAIVKHIIDSHRGEVWAVSEPGEGSVFTFVLPV
jgi:two-component system sensor histidine kinase GlrK